MSAEIQFLILLTGSPVFIFAAHLVLSRVTAFFKLQASPLHVAGTGVFAGYLLSAGLCWHAHLNALAPAQLAVAAVYGTLVYAGLAFSYFQFFAMTETARRIHILREIYHHGRLSLRTLETEYGGANMLSIRLARMVELGQLKEIQGRYYVDGKLLLYVGTLTHFWAKVVGFHGRNMS